MKKDLTSGWKPLTSSEKIPLKEEIKHPEFGTPSEIYHYRDVNGDLFYLRCRWEGGQLNKRKEFRPYSPFKEDSGIKWRFKAPPKPMPLYGSELLSQRPEAMILLVEGDKTVNFARELFHHLIVMTSGSSTSISGADWLVIRGRNVICWRDNDDAGKKWEENIIKAISGIAKRIRCVEVPHNLPPKWDLADPLPSGWDVQKLHNLISDSRDVIPAIEENTSKVDLVVSFIKSLAIELFMDQYDKVFAQITLKNGYHICIPIRSTQFRNLIKGKIYNDLNTSVSRSAFDEACDCIEGMVISSDAKRHLDVRVVNYNGTIYCDLGYTAVEITPGKISFKNNIPPLFKRHRSVTQEQVRPSNNPGNLHELFDLLNIPSQNDRLLLLVFLVAAFVPGIPHPVLVIYGPQGSGKSTLLRILIRLVDPSSIEDVQIHSVKELIQAAEHRLVLPLDNLGNLDKPISDVLCKIVTGIGTSKRELFTDDDDVVRYFRRVVIMNGINLPVNQPDLLDRSILIDLDRVDAGKRRTEFELNNRFEELRPQLVSACLHTVANALSWLDEARLVKPLPRMADFAVWGCSIAKALGYSFEEFLSAYDENVKKVHREAVDAQPIAVAITFLSKMHCVISGTPTDIMNRTKKIWEKAGLSKKDQPDNVSSFGKQFRNASQNLEALGFKFKYGKSGERSITIYSPEYAQPAQAPRHELGSDLSQDASIDDPVQLSAHSSRLSCEEMDGLDSLGTSLPLDDCGDENDAYDREVV